MVIPLLRPPSVLVPVASDYGLDGIAVCQRPLQRLEQHDGAAFGAHITIGGRIEGATAPARRKHRGLGETDEGIGMQEQIDAADQRRRGFVGAQAVAGLVQRDER